jgi:hypothetical protein
LRPCKKLLAQPCAASIQRPNQVGGWISRIFQWLVALSTSRAVVDWFSRRVLAWRVFFSRKSRRPSTDMTILRVLQKLEHKGPTVRGMRSTFRDWAADTGKPADTAEAALAHAPASRVVAAYARSDLLERPARADAGLGGIPGPRRGRCRAAAARTVERLVDQPSTAGPHGRGA